MSTHDMVKSALTAVSYYRHFRGQDRPFYIRYWYFNLVVFSLYPTGDWSGDLYSAQPAVEA